MGFVRRLLEDENGATAIEYGLIAALVAIIIVGTLGSVGAKLKTPSTRSRPVSRRSDPPWPRRGFSGNFISFRPCAPARALLQSEGCGIWRHEWEKRLLVLAALVLATPAQARDVTASSVAEILQDLVGAQAGDSITIAPGTYELPPLRLSQSGAPGRGIILRAAAPGTVELRSRATEFIKVSGSDWVFENLDIAGICANDSDCEHAFHIVAGADRTVIRHNRIRDYNAHIKGNGEGGRFPKDVLIEGNWLFDTHHRQTRQPDRAHRRGGRAGLDRARQSHRRLRQGDRPPGGDQRRFRLCLVLQGQFLRNADRAQRRRLRADDVALVLYPRHLLGRQRQRPAILRGQLRPGREPRRHGAQQCGAGLPDGGRHLSLAREETAACSTTRSSAPTASKRAARTAMPRSSTIWFPAASSPARARGSRLPATWWRGRGRCRSIATSSMRVRGICRCAPKGISISRARPWPT